MLMEEILHQLVDGQNPIVIPLSADPACSRGSASEEEFTVFYSSQ